MTQPQKPPPHTIQPPPSQDVMAQHVLEILLAAATAEAAIEALLVLFRPFGVKREAITAAYRLTDSSTHHRGTAVTPRMVGRHSLVRDARREEAYFRAAYLVRAAYRIQRDLDSGTSLLDALRAERRHWQAHEAARKARLAATKAVADAAAAHGPILGWYLNPLLNNEPECIAASGHNFDVRVGTIIGWPGTVHVGCGCFAGPPFALAGWVDAAVSPHVQWGRPKKLKPLKKVG